MRTAGVYNFLIEAGIMASLAIVLMIPVRAYARKILGNRAICFAWLLVAVRLLCPLALPNPVIHEIQTPFNHDQAHIRPIAGQMHVRLRDAVDQLRIRVYHRALVQIAQTAADSQEQAVALQNDAAMRWMNGLGESLYDGRMAHWLMYVYAAGALGTAGWFAFSNVRFRKSLKKNRMEPLSGERLESYRALCEKINVRPLPVYLTDPLPGACLVGVFRPFIALPAAASPQDGQSMLLHEMWHYKKKDHLWAVVQLLCCAVHWFNPLVWLAAAMYRTDREMKCDEWVTRGMGPEEKRAYAAVLVESATRRAQPGLPVMATGMSMTGKKLKLRVGAIVRSGKRPLAAGLVFATVASLLLVGAFATADVAHEKRIPLGLTATSGYNLRYQKYWGMQVAGQRLPDGDTALEYARELWKGEWLKQDVTGGSWRVSFWEGGEKEPPLYTVDGEMPDKTQLHMNLLPDGAVDYLFVSRPAPQAQENGTSAPHPTEAAPQPAESARPERPDDRTLREFVLQAAEALEPGVVKRMIRISPNGEQQNDSGAWVSSFEMTMHSEDPRLITVEWSPQLRLLEYGTGNG